MSVVNTRYTPDELDGHRHHYGEDHVEAEAAESLAPAEPDREKHRREHARTDQLIGPDPQDLAREQVLQIFAAVRVVGKQQDLRRGRQHEEDPDQGLLHLGPPALGPGEQQRARKRGGHGSDLRGPARELMTERVGRDDSKRGDLCDREIDEHDSALQDLLSERHVRQHDQEAGDERRPQDAEVDGEIAHLRHRQQ